MAAQTNQYSQNNKFILNISLFPFFISLNIVLTYLLPIEYLKFLYLFNMIISVIIYFTLFGKRWHPVFIFIGTLSLFQGGLFIGNINTEFNPSYIPLMGANLYVSDETVRMSVLLLILSYWFVLLGGYLGNKSKVSHFYKSSLSNNNFYRIFFLILFFITLPFYAYKQLNYFNYFLNYGYLAFYKSSEFLENVAFLTRAISFFTPISFLGYFLLENKKKKIFLIASIFFTFNIFTLLSGFRGSFFTFWLVFLLFYYLKFNSKLSILKVFLIFTFIAIVSVLISLGRESANYNISKLDKNPLLEFIKQQGVSFYVTEMAVEFSDEFSPKIFDYLLWQPISAILSTALSVPGRAFATDLMIKINYDGYLAGFGVGSAYIAEAYLLGGPPAVFFVSFFIGYLLSRLFNIFAYSNIYLKIVIFTAIQYMIYLPRDLLLMPLSQVIKVSIYLILIYFIAKFVRNFKV